MSKEVNTVTISVKEFLKLNEMEKEISKGKHLVVVACNKYYSEKRYYYTDTETAVSLGKMIDKNIERIEELEAEVKKYKPKTVHDMLVVNNQIVMTNDDFEKKHQKELCKLSIIQFLRKKYFNK